VQLYGCSAVFFLVIRGVVSDSLGEHTNETRWHPDGSSVNPRYVADPKMDRAETSPGCAWSGFSLSLDIVVADRSLLHSLSQRIEKQ
jgi:hypothetical protein